MGKGIALEFRRRFPEMFEEYKKHCDDETLKPGMILPYRKSTPWVLNFAVKNDWKHPSKIEWVEQSLQKFCTWYPKVGLKSVAFPWMGAMNGGIPLEDIQKVTRDYLSNLSDIDIEVYSFDPDAPDPLFENLKAKIVSEPASDFIKRSSIQKRFVERIYTIMEKDMVTSLSGIEAKAQLGMVSMDKLYLYLAKPTGDSSSDTFIEPELF